MRSLRRDWKRILSVTALLALAAGLYGSTKTVARTGGLVASGEPPAAFLLSTGDVIGYVDPCG